jgi:catechol 2,3-dioxygenase-like lactoylglutathione lyase family enzyme
VTLRLLVIAVDCTDPERLAAFWCAALGYEVVERSEDGVSIGPGPVPSDEQLRGGPVAPGIDFLVVPEGKAGKNRLHLDLTPGDGRQAEEVERLLGLGATRVEVGQSERPDTSWVVLADPEGNEFCVLRGRAERDAS